MVSSTEKVLERARRGGRRLACANRTDPQFVSAPLPSTGIPSGGEPTLQYRIKKCLCRVCHVDERRPRQTICSRHRSIRTLPRVERSGKRHRQVVSLSERKRLLECCTQTLGLYGLRSCQQRDVGEILHSRVRPRTRHRVRGKLLCDVRFDGVETQLGRSNSSETEGCHPPS